MTHGYCCNVCKKNCNFAKHGPRCQKILDPSASTSTINEATNIEYPDVDYNNLFFEKSEHNKKTKNPKKNHTLQTEDSFKKFIDDMTNELNKVNNSSSKVIETKSFQTQQPTNTNTNSNTNNIKRTRHGLVNKVMDTSDVQKDQAKSNIPALIKKCPGGHKLKYFKFRPKF